MRSQDRPFELPEGLGVDTLAVRAGTLRSPFGEHSEALYLTSSFTYQDAAQAAAVFSGAEEGFVYSRFSNPGVRMFERRLAALEGAPACIATGSGMAAIFAVCLAHLQPGDEVVCGANVFGATVNLFSQLLGRWGVVTKFVRGSDPASWREATGPRTRMLFCETPSNPLQEVVDLARLAALGRETGALTVVDNCFCTPALQRPLAYGVDVVVHSGTKFLDGQGRVVGGAVLGSEKFLREGILPVMRTAGPSLSPFNAWVMLKGIETLALRVRAQSAAALELARWLENQPRVACVHYSGLASHPQHALACAQQSAHGSVIGFELREGAAADARAAAWKLIDALRIFSITANLGDTRSTVTHPATTTHGRNTPEARERAGIREGLVRLAIGLENIEDLQRDLANALASD